MDVISMRCVAHAREIAICKLLGGCAALFVLSVIFMNFIDLVKYRGDICLDSLDTKSLTPRWAALNTANNKNKLCSPPGVSAGANPMKAR